LQEAKGAVGLSQYEVRSGVGWHHHLTLSLLALWFLCLEKTAVDKKTPWITVPPLRLIFARLLCRPAEDLETILEEVNAVLRRTEEARIYHWRRTTGRFPPPRRRPDS
jgi:hypothetical protein